MALQRTAGNAAVSAVLARQPRQSLQRCGDGPCACSSDLASRQDDEELEPALARSAARRRVTARQGLHRVAEASGGDEAEAVELLAMGDAGPLVSALQTALNSASPAADPTLVVDGAFGPATRGAVVEFQGANSLVPDGVVGPQTNAVLAAVGGPAPAPAEPKPTQAPDAPATGLGAAVGCHYEPGEKAESRADEGDVIGPPVPDPGTPLFSGTFAITGFEQGQATLKPRHPDFLREMTARFRLDTARPTHRIVRVEGLSDCVDTFGKNVGIRLKRGRSGRDGLVVAGGALEESVGPGIAAQEGERLSVNDEGPGGRFGRRMNRAAVFHFELVETPKEPPKEEPPDPHLQGCDFPSERWDIQPRASGTAHLPPPVPVGGDVVFFTFTNVTTGCDHFAFYVGGSIGAGAGFEVSVPGAPQAVKTTPPFGAQPGDGLTGRGELFVVGAGVGASPVGVGGSLGFIVMRSGALAGQRIDVGGLSLSPALKKKVGAKGGASISLGTGPLLVFNRS